MNICLYNITGESIKLQMLTSKLVGNGKILIKEEWHADINVNSSIGIDLLSSHSLNDGLMLFLICIIFI